MITTKNYIQKIAGIDISKLPENLRAGHLFLMKATDNGEDWDAYQSGETTRKVIDLYLEKLNTHLSPNAKPEPKKKSSVKPSDSPPRPIHTITVVDTDEEEIEDVFFERIPDELRFIKRYVGLHNKKKTKEDILRFITAMQRSITELKIRKTSIFAEEISYIQNKLIERYKSMTRPTAEPLPASILRRYKEIADTAHVFPSIQVIKRFILLNGKPDVKEKAATLLKAIEKGIEKGRITKHDKYYAAIRDIRGLLENYVNTKSLKIMSIRQAELNGLNGLLGDCGCQSAHGLEGIAENPAKPRIMNSIDFCNQKFDAIGFRGRFLRLIGDPSRGFSVMVFGRPKYGKSILCADFAGYLARNHGRVLYIAKEEGLDRTLKDKLNQPDVKHANLDVTADLNPADLQPYDFVFLDSVNTLKLSTADLQRLKEMYPGKSFVYVFQTNKSGNFRGAQEFQHFVDAVIEVPEKGHAVQNGRFNQGGELKIFEDEDYREAA